MEVEQPQNAEQPRESNNGSRKILIIICIYLLLTLSSKYSQTHTRKPNTIPEKMRSGATQINLSDVVNAFELEQTYEGRWSTIDHTPVPLLDHLNGKFELRLYRLPTLGIDNRYALQLLISNGDYADEGTTSYIFPLESDSFVSERSEKGELLLQLSDNATLEGNYQQEQLLMAMGSGSVNVSSLVFSFSVKEDNTLVSEIFLTLPEGELGLLIVGEERKMAKMLLFAIVMFLVSVGPFSALMEMLRNLYELRDNAQNYSLVSVCLSCMWDCTLCVVAFVFAFRDQQSLMLFILPAFLLCLLFTNLQPRLMIMVFQSLNNGQTMRQLLCRFNLIHYGSLIVTYPLLLWTNLNALLFLGMSAIFLPQIYVNGLRGNRPVLASPYYVKYLLSRCLIIFYLRACPINVFDLQPNYPLASVCFLVICFQFFLLHLQKIYGSKKIIPQFLLQPVFDYKLEEEFNIEEGVDVAECAICLSALHVEPPAGNSDEPSPPFRLMSTPCKHSYHSRCLVVWMKIKMQCPQCRAKLPPYELRAYAPAVILMTSEYPLIPPQAFLFFPREDEILQIRNRKPYRILFEGNLPYSSHEREHLARLHAELRKESKNQHLSFFPEPTLLRFLQATKFDIDDCISELRKYRKWEDGMLPLRLSERVSGCLKEGLFYMVGRDASYRPVLVVNVARIMDMDLKKEAFEEAAGYFFQYIVEQAMLEGQVETWITIVDLGKMGMFSMGSTVIDTITFLSNHFRCRLHHSFLVNCPSSIRFLFGMAKKAMSEDQISKITLSEEAELPKHAFTEIYPHEIEQKYGGTRPDLTQFWPIQLLPNTTTEEQKNRLISPLQYAEMHAHGQLKKKKICKELLAEGEKQLQLRAEHTKPALIQEIEDEVIVQTEENLCEQGQGEQLQNYELQRPPSVPCLPPPIDFFHLFQL